MLFSKHSSVRRESSSREQERTVSQDSEGYAGGLPRSISEGKVVHNVSQPTDRLPSLEQNGRTSPNAYSNPKDSRRSSASSVDGSEVIRGHPVFVKDSSNFWYKPQISREQAINILKEQSPGTFIVRDSNSFPGAFGLAMKVAQPPPNVLIKPGIDPATELVRHFLIEPTTKGVKIKGCSNEPVFGSLSALVYQHSITPLALPCKLVLPEKDPAGSVGEESSSSALALLTQGAACNVLYLNSVDMESLTGPQAVKRSMDRTFTTSPRPTPTIVHFKVSDKGVTLTDNQRKVFFRRHYPVESVTYCGMDPEDRRWTRVNQQTGLPVNAKCFGLVARKPANSTENSCHLFAELDPDQPASAIVNFVSKVMIASYQTQQKLKRGTL